MNESKNNLSKSSKIKVNDDIEKVLSETYSVGSNKNISDEIIIHKIDNQLNNNTNIQEKLELSSNKDIDVGLDLLVNKEKINDSDKISVNDENPNLSNAFDISSSTVKGNTDTQSLKRIENMVNNLNVDNVSRLSQEDIDLLIDQKDKDNNLNNVHEPELTSIQDLDNYINDDDVNSKSMKSVLMNNSIKNSKNKSKNKSIDNLSDKSSISYRVKSQSNLNEKRKKKQEILFKLEKMRRLGIQGIKKFNMSSDLSEMEDELNRVKHEREIESSIKFQRKCLMAFVTGAELLNNKFDFLDFKLDGWSEQVHENIDEYNEVFEELHEKYKERAKMAPEVKLLFMLGGSGFMYHVTNSMFKNSIPGMEDIMKQNPDLMKQFANAAINQMNNGEEKEAAQFLNKMSDNNYDDDDSQIQVQEFSRDIQNMSEQMNIRNHSMNEELLSAESMIGSQNKKKISTPFNNSSNKISPPVGVDEILDELRSNTNKEENISSEDISLEVSKKQNKKQNKKKNTFDLNIN